MSIPDPESTHSQKTFKILSIDGGGIKGLYSARILAEFENRFNCRVVDHFDMICGTSTGGLIALGLSLSIPAKEICTFYQTKGDQIFKPQNTFKSFIKQLFISSKHSNQSLKSCLHEIFGDKVIGESKALLCIPAFSITNGRPYIFKYDHKEGELKRDNNTPYVDVALATSAAPTFLPVVTIPSQGDRQFADGGVYANNPTLIGVTEAFHYFVGSDREFQKLMVMSIASLEPPPPGRSFISRQNRSLLSWIKTQDLFNLFMEGQAQVNNHIVSVLSQHTACSFDYIRIPSVQLPDEHAQIIKMDNASKKALSLISMHGEEQGFLFLRDPMVTEFFANKKQYMVNSNG